jgi:hypothetical protein
MLFKRSLIGEQYPSKRANLGFFQVPLHLSSFTVYVKSNWSSLAGFRLNGMHYAFARFFVVEYTKAEFVYSWKRIAFTRKRLLNMNILCFQMVFDDFLPLQSKRWLGVLATDDFARAANFEVAGFSHIFIRHRAVPSEIGFVI